MSTITFPHEWADFVDVIKEVENSIKLGYDNTDKTWKPHPSLEGGTPTIAYGHKLLQRDIDNGDVLVKGVFEPLYGLSDDAANDLLIQDIKNAEARVFGEWNATTTDVLSGNIPLKYRAVLAALAFNIGTLRNPSTGNWAWPNLKKAILENNDKKVREEMVTSYKTPSGTRVRLTERAKAVADAIGLDNG